MLPWVVGLLHVFLRQLADLWEIVREWRFFSSRCGGPPDYRADPFNNPFLLGLRVYGQAPDIYTPPHPAPFWTEYLEKMVSDGPLAFNADVKVAKYDAHVLLEWRDVPV